MSARPVGRKAWCPKCREVDMVDAQWRCLWCNTVTLATLNTAGARVSRALTIAQLLSLHERYAVGESLASLARESFTGRDTLKENFWAAGLPTRSQAAANGLEAPRRRVVRHLAERNAAYRSDLDDQAIVTAYARTHSLRITAREIGCGVATVHRRLTAIGHPRNAVGRNQHLRGLA